MDSVSRQQYATPLLLCPGAQFINKEDEFRWTQFGELPYLSDAKYDKSSLASSSHIIPLDCNNDGTHDNITCKICTKTFVGAPFYSCNYKECFYNISQSSTTIGFHRECIQPLSMHPFHPKHSLRFLDNLCAFLTKICKCCLSLQYWVYDCSICDFTMCRGCARMPPLLAIDHPKRHEHTLFYFSIKGSFVCDVCALDHRSLMYSCRNCDFKAHKDCVYLPSIVRISRHQHRLSFTSSLTPEKWFCGVCRGKIDTTYGRYSCVKGCSYGVHSKCSSREDVWDGKELEGQPEDPYEDIIKSFDEISDGIIQHFSHQNHYMRLDDETNRKFGENKRCQACTLAICDEIIYSCMQCDFILHQDCAQLPLRKQHPTHPHPLSLQVDYHNSWFKCKACYRESNGFKYFCLERKCKYELDVCCASISEPFDHQCHPHPLFFIAKPQTKQICSICHVPQSHQLNCGECGFVLCFRCATLPNKLRYKHDEHFLIFAYDKDASGQYWCDVCEKEACSRYGIYVCNICKVTLHHECFLGKDMHLMPGGIFKYGEENVDIILNNRFTRNICMRCHNRCEEKIVFKIYAREIIFCSFGCLQYYC